MIGFITNIAPIMLGFVGKLFALKSQAAAENQKLMIQNLQVRNKDGRDIWMGDNDYRVLLWCAIS